MKTELNVSERMAVLSLLPNEGNIVTLKMIRTLTENLALSPQEITEFEVVLEGPTVRWNQKGNATKKFEFHDAEAELVKARLKDLDSKSKLTQGMISIYEKFVG